MNKAKKPKSSPLLPSLGRVFSYMRSDILGVILSLILAAAAAVLTIIGPDRIGLMTEKIREGLFTEIDMSGVARIGISLVIIYASGAIFNFIQHFVMSTVTLKASKKLRSALSVKINKVPLSYFNSTTQGNILSRVTNDVQMLQQGLSQSLPGIIGSVAQFVGCLIMMFVTEWRLALCVIAVTFVGMFILMSLMGRSQRYFVAKQEHIGTLNGYVEEMYSGHEVVRISRAGEEVVDHFEKLNRNVYDSNWKSQFISGVMQPLMMVIGNIGYVAVCVVGAALAMNGTIAFGVIISFILYVRLFTSPLTQIAQGMTNLQASAASAGRIFDLLDAPELEDESHKKAVLQSAKGHVEFEHVRFSYPDHPEKIIIKDFSATVLPGQKVAIVGPTGAGKTTMVNLLMRFFEINSGSIRIDGYPISELRRENIHNLFGMVLQDTWLFEGTVRENLVYNMEDISEEELKKACKVCGIYRFIRSLPKGFETVLSDNTNISAGQKQLMTIARAMLQNSPMLILDEATSSVDTRTEIMIQRAMDELTKGRTSFVIAHRLSTIKNADLILVMKDGDVIESGNHESLMAQNGFYTELYNSQFEKSS